jgi:hypothetical protein
MFNNELDGRLKKLQGFHLKPSFDYAQDETFALNGVETHDKRKT